MTGETFRKVGKTDIHIVFDKKAAFIGECKIWGGIKAFEDAVKQLYSYSTWKDSKVALIVFNKKVNDFNSIRRQINSWATSNAKQHKIVNGNVWKCKIYREDTNSEIDVAVALYDIKSRNYRCFSTRHFFCDISYIMCIYVDCFF